MLVGRIEFAYMVKAGSVETTNSAGAYEKDMNCFLRTEQSVNLYPFIFVYGMGDLTTHLVSELLVKAMLNEKLNETISCLYGNPSNS